MKAVFDTSTLQAVWRGGVLGDLGRVFAEVLVPQSVADETRWSRATMKNGRKLVPDIDELDFTVCVVPYEDLRAAVLKLFGAARDEERGKRMAAHVPHVALRKGKFYVWGKHGSPGSQRNSRTFDVPDLEVVVLAQQTRAFAVVDDKKAQQAASLLNVVTLNTRQVLALLVKEGVIADDSVPLKKIEATGYLPTTRIVRGST
jgi:predicted nucleic acid-binding protein